MMTGVDDGCRGNMGTKGEENIEIQYDYILYMT